MTSIIPNCISYENVLNGSIKKMQTVPENVNSYMFRLLVKNVRQKEANQYNADDYLMLSTHCKGCFACVVLLSMLFYFSQFINET